MAIGDGDFFSPCFAGEPFYLQLPLVPGLMASFFYVLGDHWWVDKLFNLTVALACWAAVVWIWHEALHVWELAEHNWRTMSWWPSLLVIVTPSLYWGWKNGVVEPTVALFSLLHVALLFKYLRLRVSHEKLQAADLFYVLAGGVFLFLSFYAKPPLGLFTIAAPVVLLFIRPPKVRVADIVLLIAIQASVVILCCIVLYRYAPARENLHLFFQKQWLPLISEAYEPRKLGRFNILLGLLNEVLVMVYVVAGFTVLSLIIRLKVWRSSFTLFTKPALFFLLLGLAGSVPLMVTATQYERYLIPALPFFALGIAFGTLNLVHPVQSKIMTWEGVGYLNRVVLAGVVCWLFLSLTYWGTPLREREVQNDLALMAPYIAGRRDVAIHDSLEADNEIKIYAARFYRTHMGHKFQNPSFMVTTKAFLPDSSWAQVEMAGLKYQLYRKREALGR